MKKYLKQLFCSHLWEREDYIIKYIQYLPIHVYGKDFTCKKCGKEKREIEVSD